MDEDRIKGMSRQAGGAVKETVGKAVCDAKLAHDGHAERTIGKAQNAVGGVKDKLREELAG